MTEERKQLVIGKPSDLPLPIGALLDMLRYVRAQTLHAVKDLSIAQLDHRHDAESNSIGTLLWHIAAVEVWYQVNSFDAREWTPADAEEWDTALDMGEKARSLGGYPLEHYVEILSSVRERTESELAKRDVEWLLHVGPLDDDADANEYWKWFHVGEDEIGHCAQIRWLKKRLPKVASGDL